LAGTRNRWRARDWALLLGGLAAAGLIRALLLPTEGLRGDIDQFVRWVHGIAGAPLGEAYRMNLSFPPVMVYVFAFLSAIEPAFRTVTDGSDPAIRTLMKLPATLADFGLAALVAWVLRDRPRWAVGAALAVLLTPAVFYDSAWWGQFESIYTLSGLTAVAFALSGRDRAAAALLAVSLMTKPQAFPFLVPFAAWFLARHGLRGSVPLALVGAAVAALLWLPFIADGGPGRYLGSLAGYQGDVFAVLSLRAWNLWWLVQEAYGGGSFLSDGGAIIGPLTPRFIGLSVTALLELVVFLAVLRAPSGRTLVLGLTASVLVAFAFLTTMHERYAYAALVFGALLLADRVVRPGWVALATVVSLNLVAASPPTRQLATLLPISGPLGAAGAVVILAITAVTLILLVRDSAAGGHDLPAAPGGLTESGVAP